MDRQCWLTSENIEPFTITLSNDAGERVVVGYDKGANNYFIDRSNSGKVSFEKGFSGIHTAPRLREGGNFDLILIIDEASVELFADKGLSVMTEVFFPNSRFSAINVEFKNNFRIKSMTYDPLKSIW